MRLEIAVPPFMRYCLISIAIDFFWRGPSIILIIFLQVVEVGRLSNQFWRVFDNFIRWESFAACKPLRVLLSTPSRSPISRHLEEVEERNFSRTCFFGSETVTKYRLYLFYWYSNFNKVITTQKSWRYVKLRNKKFLKCILNIFFRQNIGCISVF